MRFLQRIGKSSAARLVQRETIDEELRSSMWSVLAFMHWEAYSSPGDSMFDRDDFVNFAIDVLAVK